MQRIHQAALASSTEGLADFTTRASQWGYAQVCAVFVAVWRHKECICVCVCVHVLT